MSGKAIRESIGFIAVVAGLAFVGLEIQQNNKLAQAAAYQEIGFYTAESWWQSAHDRDYTELELLSFDPTRWDEIDEVGWRQLASGLTAIMRGSETVFLQVEQGLLPSDAMQRLGYGVDPHVYMPNSFDRLWEEIRPRMDAEFAAYIEQQFVTP